MELLDIVHLFFLKKRRKLYLTYIDRVEKKTNNQKKELFTGPAIKKKSPQKGKLQGSSNEVNSASFCGSHFDPTLIQANPSFLILAMMVVRVVATWRNILVFLSHQSSQPTSIIRDFKGPLGMCGV